MKCVNIFLVVVFLAMLVYEFDASCSYMPKDPPGANASCVTPAGNLAVGDCVNDNATCNKYTCGESRISVCGFGYNAGPMSVDGCVQQLLDDCCYRFVNATDPSEICVETICS